MGVGKFYFMELDIFFVYLRARFDTPRTVLYSKTVLLVISLD